MTATVVFDQNNMEAPATPPDYYMPDANGSVMPNSQKRWRLDIETAGLPEGQLLANITIEYRRPAWTDNAGANHPANEWMPDAGAPLTTGVQAKGGTVAHLASSIGSRDSDGNLLYAYPNRFRFHIKECPGYVSIPNVKLTMFDTI